MDRVAHPPASRQPIPEIFRQLPAASVTMILWLPKCTEKVAGSIILSSSHVLFSHFPWDPPLKDCTQSRWKTTFKQISHLRGIFQIAAIVGSVEPVLTSDIRVAHVFAKDDGIFLFPQLPRGHSIKLFSKILECFAQMLSNVILYTVIKCYKWCFSYNFHFQPFYFGVCFSKIVEKWLAPRGDWATPTKPLMINSQRNPLGIWTNQNIQ